MELVSANTLRACLLHSSDRSFGVQLLASTLIAWVPGRAAG
jgi:hypothetical protein